MAEVWEAYDHVLQVWRAIKFVHPQLAQRPGILRRFTAEAHAMARLEHPNVVRIYDVGAQDDGTPYLVMELANGGSIEGYLERYQKMDPRLAVSVVLDVCSGVQAAHDEGIVHRDLKPDNLLIDRRGTCKVTDFGIAQLQTTDNRTKTGSVMGTLAYMAPEQRTDAKHIGPPADVYALATTLYAMVTGETPSELFMCEHHPEMLDAVPEPLRGPLLDALRYTPDSRTQSVDGLAEALRNTLHELPTSDGPVPALITGSTNTAMVPSQPREPATGLDEHTLLPEDVASVRNMPDTLEPDQLAAMMPELFGELAADLQQDTQRLEAEQRRNAARARLEALQARKSTPPPAVSPPPSEAASESNRTPDVPSAAVEPVKKLKTGRTDGDGPWEMVLAAFDLAWKLISGPGKPIAILVVLVVFPMTLLLANSASAINSAAARTRAAESAFLLAVSADDQLPNDLDAAGLNTSQVRLARAKMNGTPPEVQLELAQTYVSQTRGLLVNGARHAPAEAAEQLASGRGRLEALMNGWRTAHDTWTTSASSASGRSACAAGFADCP